MRIAEQIATSITANAINNIQNNIDLIESPTDSEVLAQRYIKEKGSLISRDINIINAEQLKEVSATIALLHAQAVYIKTVCEEYLEEIVRTEECNHEQATCIKNLHPDKNNILDAGGTSDD